MSEIKAEIIHVFVNFVNQNVNLQNFSDSGTIDAC